MRLKPYKSINNEGNIFWVTMTDLMTALLLVFIVLFFYSYMTNVYAKIEQDAEKRQVSEILNQSFKEQNINANVDLSTGMVKISDLELFDVNSYELSNKGKKYLDKFAPTYFNSIIASDYLNNNLQNIVIQGHTDSQTYRGKFSEDEQYMKNMELSLKRAFAVANYMTNTAYNKANSDKLRKMIIVEGASFSSPIVVNNKEDFDKSRRVELKLIMSPSLKHAKN